MIVAESRPSEARTSRDGKIDSKPHRAHRLVPRPQIVRTHPNEIRPIARGGPLVQFDRLPDAVGSRCACRSPANWNCETPASSDIRPRHDRFQLELPDKVELEADNNVYSMGRMTFVEQRRRCLQRQDRTRAERGFPRNRAAAGRDSSRAGARTLYQDRDLR